MSKTKTIHEPKRVPGDVVQLRSGGPEMTFESYEEDELYTQAVCLWFRPDGVMERAGFHPATLRGRGEA